MNAEQLILDYHHIFTQLHKQYKWTHKPVLMASAAMYIMTSQTFNLESFIHTANAIKRQANLFSPMRSHLRLTTASVLETNFEDPIQHIPRLFEIYGELIKPFKRSHYTYIAATIILTNNDEVSHKEMITKAKSIYDNMKKEHPFLTGPSDFPLATILAYEGRDDLNKRMEYFYDTLCTHSFQKGNHLQFLTHILSISQEKNDILINRVTLIYDNFKRAGIKRKSMYYPVMGMLALLEPDVLDIDEVTDMYEHLNRIKHFKWQKDMNIMMAASFFVSQKLESSSMAQASLHTTVEALIQAQQAVMVAAMASSASASAGSTNSS